MPLPAITKQYLPLNVRPALESRSLVGRLRCTPLNVPVNTKNDLYAKLRRLDIVEVFDNLIISFRTLDIFLY